MKLAVSNLAWPTGADAEAAGILARHGVGGVELAPGKAWPKPIEATDAEVAAVRRWWDDRGFRVVAFQALVFGRPELLVFGPPEVQDRFVEYLTKIIRLAAGVGAGALVFGSPKNRSIGNRSKAEAWPTAIEFFRRVGTIAAEHGTAIGLEPNPPEYGCDFITRVGEAAELVRDVNSPGFRLHLDAGQMAMTGDTVAAAAGVMPVHFHISEPNLQPIGTVPTVPHLTIARDLRAIGYDGWHSIEVRQPDTGWQDALERSLVMAKMAYDG